MRTQHRLTRAYSQAQRMEIDANSKLMGQVLAAIKANPGKFNYSSIGVGTVTMNTRHGLRSSSRVV